MCLSTAPSSRDTCAPVAGCDGSGASDAIVVIIMVVIIINIIITTCTSTAPQCTPGVRR